ncbi:MAG: amidohydrolase [Candidatus Obscuribacterales bacterium]|nr:amidohydrolase [Candidatus Obscuribacterales bacterium]
MSVRLALVLITLISILSSLPAFAARERADTVLLNASVHTMDAARSIKEAVCIAGDRIIYVGSNKGARRFIENATKVLDLKGRMVLPGFQDCHVHLVEGGMHLNECNLDDLKSVDEVVDMIKSYRDENPQKEWIKGSGWGLPLFKNANARKELLDKIESKKPVFLESQDYHSAWVNSKALELAGITADSKDPEGGHIEKDPKTGEPTGTLRESAIELVQRHLPPPTEEEFRKGLLRGQELAATCGITSIQDASVSPQVLAAYEKGYGDGILTVNVNTAIKIDPLKEDDAQVENIKILSRRYRENHREDLLKVSSAKIFADGVIEARTANLLRPYSDKAGGNGKLNFAPERLASLVTKLESAGIQVHIHSIGDGATRASLDAFDRSRRQHPENRRCRSHIAHLELIDKSDLPRFASLSISATIQPYWAQPDEYIVRLTEPVLGKKRSQNIYPFKSLRDEGARLAGGSDWPVSTLSPLEAIQVAVTRRGIDKEGDCWLPHQKLILKDCLEAYTINGAFINHRDSENGSLEVGKQADIVVLDRDLYTVPAGELARVKVLKTIFRGKEIYSREDLKE